MKISSRKLDGYVFILIAVIAAIATVYIPSEAGLGFIAVFLSVTGFVCLCLGIYELWEARQCQEREE